MQDVMTALSCFLFEDLENDRLYFGGSLLLQQCSPAEPCGFVPELGAELR